MVGEWTDECGWKNTSPTPWSWPTRHPPPVSNCFFHFLSFQIFVKTIARRAILLRPSSQSTTRNIRVNCNESTICLRGLHTFCTRGGCKEDIAFGEIGPRDRVIIYKTGRILGGRSPQKHNQSADSVIQTEMVLFTNTIQLPIQCNFCLHGSKRTINPFYAGRVVANWLEGPEDGYTLSQGNAVHIYSPSYDVLSDILLSFKSDTIRIARNWNEWMAIL